MHVCVCVGLSNLFWVLSLSHSQSPRNQLSVVVKIPAHNICLKIKNKTSTLFCLILPQILEKNFNLLYRFIIFFSEKHPEYLVPPNSHKTRKKSKIYSSQSVKPCKYMNEKKKKIRSQKILLVVVFFFFIHSEARS